MGWFLSKKEVSSHTPISEDWELHGEALAKFEAFKFPQLYDRKDPHSRLFVALADGTENDLKNPRKYTNVGLLNNELKRNNSPHVARHYVSGVGTYKGGGTFLTKASAKLDAAFSLTDRQRAEELYESLSKQLNTWKQEDPDARISVVQVGFSRGAGVVTLLNRMIHEKGIIDENKVRFRDGQYELTGEHLIKPGQLRQAALLYDPVTTFMQGDFTLSPSTVSALQLNAAHEYRALFPVTSIAHGPDQLQATLPGCHADIGGGYEKDGLARYARDMGNTYLNQLAGHALFRKPVLPPRDDPSCVIHHSWEHNTAYGKLAERQVVQGAMDRSKETVPSSTLPDVERATLPPTESLPKDGPFKEKADDFRQMASTDLLEKYPGDQSVLDAVAVRETGRKFAGRYLPNETDRARFMNQVDSRLAHNLEYGQRNPAPRILEKQETLTLEAER
ncbi:MAG: DUF2235 domain-containing protein [Syntrophotalea sp.]|uniref:T6SS phospholipase effector Tle1-like catalytic domain-containing protein n=1 Tax=Syntrophotalea sp. TaxID=2812029 RepID=UPI003D0D56ED